MSRTPTHGEMLTVEETARTIKALQDPGVRGRIAELEGDLSVARLQLQRIDEQLVGWYGEIETTKNVGELRRILGNIAYIVKPSR